MVSLDFLEGVELFEGLDDNQLTAVRGYCQEAEYHRGDKIFGIKEEPLYLYAVMEGEVALRHDWPDGESSQEDTISTISEKRIFGWSSLVPPSEYRLSAHCITRHCKVLKIDSKGLCRLFEEDSKLGYMVMSKIVSVVGSRFYQLREEIIKRRGQDIINRW
jgi:signal-transduction protein with cAMP-binding, CBS, and nucleotidyltransferase domain